MIIRQNVLGVMMSRKQKYTTTFAEFEVYEDKRIISPMQRVRQSWEEQFQQMAAVGDDQLLDGDFPLTGWETEKWIW